VAIYGNGWSVALIIFTDEYHCMYYQFGTFSYTYSTSIKLDISIGRIFHEVVGVIITGTITCQKPLLIRHFLTKTAKLTSI